MRLSPEAFVDGFPSDTTQADYQIHRIIDSELRNCQALAGTQATNGMRYPAYFAASEAERRSWLEPALRRAEWNAGKQPWQGHLSGLIRLLLPRSWNQTTLSDETLLLL